MPAWLIPAITAALSTAGTIATNKANRRMANDQMRFQERMSSTAAQRSRADFQAAGLNPALAYGTTASTPGGSTAQMDNPTERGISSAMATKRFMQDIAEQKLRMKVMQDQNEADKALKKANEYKAVTEGGLTTQQGYNLQQEYNFNAINQPAIARLNAARALIEELSQSRARGEAKYSEKLGMFRPMLQDIFGSARSITQLLQGVGK